MLHFSNIVTFFFNVNICITIILVGQELPYTLSPEYLAAQRAYMRYHNMNPIWGISSKEARNADDH
jgi:hypothetical protein